MDQQQCATGLLLSALLAGDVVQQRHAAGAGAQQHMRAVSC